MLNEQYLFAVRHLDYRLVRVRYLFDPFIFYVWGQITLNGNFRKSVPICFNGTEIQCRGQVWWKSAIAKLPKSRLELLTKKLRLRGTRPSPHFAANEPKISWTLSPLNLYMSTTLVRIDWGLPELFPVHEYHILSGLTGDCRSYFRKADFSDPQSDYNIHRVSKKTVHFYFCYNFVKFPWILISFGTWMTKWLKCVLYKYFPSDLSHDTTGPTTLWNSDVLNCYITLKCIICNKLSDDWISIQ